MPDVSFVNLLIVAAIAFVVPLLLGLLPRLLVPGSVLELAAGIVLGPALGWVTDDAPVDILATLGLALLLFLAGLEIDLQRLRGKVGGLALLGFGFSIVLSALAAAALAGGSLVETPLIVGVMLVSTSLGVVIPVLKDAKRTRSELGQFAIAGGSIAEFGSIVLLSLLFSNQTETLETKLLLLAGLGLLAGVAALVLARAERSVRISGVFSRLQDTTAEIRVRGAMLLMLGFVALVEGFGQEVILGSFVAGVVLRIADPEVSLERSHPRLKLDAIGYGFLVPVFFVTSGIRFDLDALLHGGGLARVPLFVLALVVVRGLPALLYARSIGGGGAVAVGLLQATSLTFIVAASQIGVALGRISNGTASAMIAAGLVSVLLFPLLALLVLRRQTHGTGPDDADAE